MSRPRQQPPAVSDGRANFRRNPMAAGRQQCLNLNSHQAGGTSAMASSTLPAEVLCGIFSMVAASSVTDFEEFGRAKQASWIAVCHVCSHWRKAALDCASLWADLMFHKPGLPEFMLAHSKGSPLTIEFNAFNQDIAPFVNVLCQAISQTHRLRSLVIRRENVRDWKLDVPRIISTGCIEAPILEKLVLSRHEQLDYSAEEVIPEDFLSKGAPRLSHLNLTGCTVRSWGSIPLGAGLKFLQLHAHLESTPIRPDPATFFDALSNMKSLEVLSLSKTAPTEALPLSARYVLPPTLRKFALEDTSEPIYQLFRHVAVPSTAKLAVTFIDLHDDGVLEEFISLLESSWDRGIRTGVYGLEYMPDDGEKSRLTFALNGSLTPSLDVSFRSLTWGQGPTMDIDDAFFVFYEQLNMTTLFYFKIWQDNPWSSETWRTFFGHLPDLYSVELHRNALLGFLGTLQEEWNQPDSSSAPLFPSLRWVVCDEIDFDKKLGRLYGVETIDCLVEMAKRFATRRKFRLGLRECTDFGPQEFKRLQEVSPDLEVEWDGKAFFLDPMTSDESEDYEEGSISVCFSQTTKPTVAVPLPNVIIASSAHASCSSTIIVLQRLHSSTAAPYVLIGTPHTSGPVDQCHPPNPDTLGYAVISHLLNQAKTSSSRKPPLATELRGLGGPIESAALSLSLDPYLAGGTLGTVVHPTPVLPHISIQHLRMKEASVVAVFSSSQDMHASLQSVYRVPYGACECSRSRVQSQPSTLSYLEASSVGCPSETDEVLGTGASSTITTMRYAPLSADGIIRLPQIALHAQIGFRSSWN
ncbi:hypothetical protein NMY22_g840 [Coprinellus aureogranulatus]|nr:hypothetical protein NMY22_g840 [Coprinellus aureogranulatus]